MTTDRVPGGNFIVHSRKTRKYKMTSMRLPRMTGHPKLFRNFLRLNDRKKYYYPEDFVKAGYYKARCDIFGYNREEVFKWCDSHYGDQWASMGTTVFFFLTEKDAMLFMLRWS